MKHHFRTFFLSLISLVLSILSVIFCALGAPRTSEETTATTRTIVLEQSKFNPDEYFDSYSISSDDRTPSFHGTSDYCEDNGLFFDNLALKDEKSEYTLSYDCAFDMENLEYSFSISIVDSNGVIVDSSSSVSPAFVTDNGSLDAYIELGDETFLLSELENDIVNNCICGWLVSLVVVVIVVKVVEVYHIVTETAEQIKSLDNLKYNRNLESQNNGVDIGNYIYAQNESSVNGYKCADYHFGFTTFKNVGCEVASAYNALIALGKAEYLSQTIYTFEQKAIEYAFAWGNFGSDPQQIYKFFDARNVSYKKYTNFSKFETAVNSKSSCYIVMSQWNEPWTTGLHTYYIRKENSSTYHGYNFHYKSPSYTEDCSDINDYNTGDKFIIGYILSNN